MFRRRKKRGRKRKFEKAAPEVDNAGSAGIAKAPPVVKRSEEEEVEEDFAEGRTEPATAAIGRRFRGKTERLDLCEALISPLV